MFCDTILKEGMETLVRNIKDLAKNTKNFRVQVLRINKDWFK